jgi:REP element-mobilizing transposase RayT
MAHDPAIHPFEKPQGRHRRSIRLKGYDYTSPGVYFVTVVAYHRDNIFGEIAGGGMRVNEWGEIAHMEWMKTAEIRPEIKLDEFVIMPNHMHAIIAITECGNGLVGAQKWVDGRDENAPYWSTNVGAQRRCAPTVTSMPNVIPKSIGAIIRAYKSIVTNRINIIRGTPGAPVWQRNYYEHIVRNEDALSRIREYIRFNPAGWNADDENPRGLGAR